MAFKRTQNSDQTATIATSGTTSNAINNTSSSMIGLIFPTMVGTAVTFTVCASRSGTFVPLRDSANALVGITLTDGAAHTVPVDLMPWPYFKIVSGSTETSGAVITVVQKA